MALKHIDHVTVVVADLAAARRFFSLLGFKEDKAVVISGPVMDRYMGVPGIEADHVTLVMADANPRCEVQLLHYRHNPRRVQTPMPIGWIAWVTITCASPSPTSTR
jgi:hypothetical protein